MHSPQLHALGFDVLTMDELIKAAFKAGVRGIQKAPGFDLIGAYTDPSGARVSFLKRTGQPMSITGGLAATTTYRAQVLRFTDLLARVTLYGPDHHDDPPGQLISFIDDPTSVPHSSLTQSKEFSIVQALRIGALALDVTVYPDETAFTMSPEARLGDNRLAPQSLLSPSLLALQAAAIGPLEASPTLLMGVIASSVEIRRNELTGAEFQWVEGESVIDLTCALPCEIPVEPGNVMHGTWFSTVSTGLWDRA